MEEELIQNLQGIDDTDLIDETLDENANVDESELEGLARRFNFPYRRHEFRHALHPIFRRHLKSAIRKMPVRSTVTKGQALLFSKRSKLNTSTREAIKNGEVKFRDLLFYIRRNITAEAGMTDTIEAKIDKEAGVTNLEKGMLPAKVNMMLSRVEINFDQASDITEKTADLDPLTSSDDNAIYNGELELLVGSRTIFRLPVNSFVHPDRRSPEGPKNGFNLSAPVLIKENENIQARFHLVGTLPASSTANSIVEVKLIGDGIAPDQ